MSENQSTRRKFLKFLGLFAGTTMVSTNAFAGFVDTEKIKKLKPAQREFMLRYGQWMDEFTEVVRVQKSNPGDMQNQKKMMVLTEKVEMLNPQLAEFMKDEDFAMIYHGSIRRMSDEIEKRKT
jgi:hypothetical protein